MTSDCQLCGGSGWVEVAKVNVINAGVDADGPARYPQVAPFTVAPCGHPWLINMEVPA